MSVERNLGNWQERFVTKLNRAMIDKIGLFSPGDKLTQVGDWYTTRFVFFLDFIVDESGLWE